MAYVAEERRSTPVTTTRGGRGSHVAGGAALLVARVIRFCFGIVAAVIVVAIVLKLCNANPHNEIVRNFHSAAWHLVGPFRSLFTIHNVKAAIVVNWGLAAIVISAVGGFLAAIVARIGLAAEGV